MKKSDLYYEVSAKEYMIFYKHRKIGGRYFPEKGAAGKRGMMQKKENSELAEIDIHMILEGRGDKRYHDVIERIDDSFEKYRKS